MQVITFPFPERAIVRIVICFKSRAKFLEVAEIVYCKAERNYTRLYLTNGKSFVICRT